MFISLVKSKIVSRQRFLATYIQQSSTQERLVLGLLLFIVVGIVLFKFYTNALLDTQKSVQALGPHLEAQTPSTSFSPKASCLRSEWTWREYDSFAWCEIYSACELAVPECPGGNEHWSKIQESSRICKTTNANGYRVYCHSKDNHMETP